ncbi:MAG: toll/interleukin-1 receptor domain-containing protein [Ferruginibacter sp.]
MAYIKGFAYDIFISYSHLDNQKLFDQDQGWIERFCSELNKMISQRIGMPDAIKIWWDNRKLDGSVLFDQSIETAIRQSAIILCLNSSAYLKSEYCKKELNLFYNKAQQEPQGLNVGDRSRIFNVLLNNISYTKWPKELSGTTGFNFNDAKDNEDLGDPLDISDPQLRNQLKDLRNAVVKLIEEFSKRELNEKTSATPKENRFSIFMGEVSDSLRTTRKRTIIDLEKQGYKVVSGIPPPDLAEAHAKKVKEEVEKADLSVHLLDQYPGREIEDNEGIWYPQKQVQLSLEFAKSQLIWVPSEMNIEEVEEEPYRNFMQDLESGKQSSKNIEYIRGAKSTLTQQITDLAEKMKIQQKQPVAGEKVAVLLDTHLEDQKYAWEMSMSMLENHIQPFVNPQEDDPRDNSTMLGDRISQVNKLVFFYGKVNWTWVQRRINAAMKLILNNDYPADEFFIFLLPPHKNPDDIAFGQRFIKVNVINNSDSSQLQSDSLQQFFKNLKVVA